MNCTQADLDRVPDLERLSAAVRILILDRNLISYLGLDSFGPSNRSSLQRLELRENNLSIVGDRAFDPLSGLRYLYLDSNRISSLPATIFRSTPELQTLSLAWNPIGSTGDSDWAFLGQLGSSLKYLDVSYTAVVSPNPRLPPAFSSLTALKDLSMRKLMNLNFTSEFFQPLAAVDLRALDLSVSVIKSVDEEAFRPLEHLRDLDMSNVMVDSKSCANIFYGLANSSLEKVNLQGVFTYDEYPVLPDLFHHLRDAKLRELNFAGNYVGLRGRIPSRLFHPLKTLRKLHLDDCDLVSVHRDTFHGLHELKTLTLRRNLLSCVHGSDCGFLGPEHAMRHLETLDLADNRILESENTVHFEGAKYPVLGSLILRKNLLRTIPVGMFGAVKQLTHLDLSENPLEDLEAGAFSLLESLTHLNLDGCAQLTRLRQDDFKGLVQLTSLSIRNGGLIHIHHGTLVHLPHLEDLRLRNNRLGQNSDAVAKLILKKSNLKSLDLGENDLTSIPRGLLSNSFHLRRLYLDGNRLSDCRPLALTPGGLTKLEVLDLSYNTLVDPDETCFRGLNGLLTVDLSANPYYCTCRTQDLSRWLRSSGWSLAMEDEYVCAAPESLVGKNIFQLGLGTFDCYWKYGVLCGLLVGLLAIAGVVILVLCFRQGRSSHGIVACNGVATGESAAKSVGDAVPGCAVFGKSAPYAPLEEEETTTPCVDGQEASTNGVHRAGRNGQSAVGQPRHLASAAATKKPSKCNGFSRGKTRKQVESPDDAAMQTRALVHAQGDDDLCHVSPCFLSSATANDVENAVEQLEDTTVC